jgi:hypothetical protein
MARPRASRPSRMAGERVGGVRKPLTADFGTEAADSTSYWLFARPTREWLITEPIWLSRLQWMKIPNATSRNHSSRWGRFREPSGS